MLHVQSHAKSAHVPSGTAWKLYEPLIVMEIVIVRCGDTTQAVGSQGWLLSPSSEPRFRDTS
jgi:hypothetical protein